MIERLKICWYILTKKYYAFYAFDRTEAGNTGAKCYIKSDRDVYKLFLNWIISFNKKQLNNE